jgi:hypothetical protein
LSVGAMLLAQAGAELTFRLLLVWGVPMTPRQQFDKAMRFMRGTPKARALCFERFECAIAAVRAESVCSGEHHCHIHGLLLSCVRCQDHRRGEP